MVTPSPTRDHPSDSRAVHLRYTDQGMAVAMAFFGRLGQFTERVMDGFDPAELDVIERFLASAAEALHDQVNSLGGPDTTEPEGA